MLKIKQVVVIGSVILLMAALLSMDIKGLVKPQQRGVSNTNSSESAALPVVTVDAVSATAKQTLNADLAKQITNLENTLKSEPKDKLAIQKQLAQKWDDVNLSGPAAFYYEFIANAESNYSNWIKTGDRFTDAYQNTQDSLTQPALVQKAIGAYQKAAELNPGSLEAKTGLGIAYVSGTPNPVQGIQLLLEVVKQGPDNIKANLNLGLFSMKSGQYEKAVNRFKTVIAQKPDAEVWFYLASTYENLGNKEEAIAAYLQSKDLAADPKLGQYVDQRIQELRK